jgi:hypothetical protein
MPYLYQNITERRRLLLTEFLEDTGTWALQVLVLKEVDISNHLEAPATYLVLDRKSGTYF